MIQFKIGDKVKCVSKSDELDYGNNLIIGNTYTVKGYHKHVTDELFLVENDWGSWKQERFELVEENKHIIKQDIPYNERWGRW